MKAKVLVLGNPLNHEGGMVSFNRGLIDSFKNNSSFVLSHFSIGSKMELFYYPLIKRLIYPFKYFFDILRLIFSLTDKNIKIIQLNPSLIPIPLIRDGFVQWLNRLFFKRKAVIVLHGWKPHIYEQIRANKIYSALFKSFFNSADVIFVLSEDFRDKLIDLNIVDYKIKVTTTFFYKKKIISPKPKVFTDSIVRFIYLGRVSKLKGIDELIEAFDLLSKDYNNFTCKIIGHGDSPDVLNRYKKIITNKGLNDKINFLGRITGPAKYELLSLSDIYVFPSYMEGCPTSVIEALASGLFVVSTDVGALGKIIDIENGLKIKPRQIEELKEALVYCIKNIKLIRDLKLKIIDDAHNKYEVSEIAKTFANTYVSILKDAK